MRRRCVTAVLLVLTASAVVVPARAQDTNALQHEIDSKLAREQRLGSQADRLGRLEARLTHQADLIQTRLNHAENDLAHARDVLNRTQIALRSERSRAVRLRARLAQTREALRTLLVDQYQAGTPDLMTVVLNSNGFADLLDRAEFLRRVRDRDTDIVTTVKNARYDAKTEATRLSRLERTRADEETQVQTRRDAIATMAQGITQRRDQVAQARNARLLLKHQTEASRQHAAKTLSKLLAQQRKALFSPGPGGPWAIPWAIVQCESGGRNVGPNYLGASGYYQFMPATWRGLGGSTPNAYQASKAEQDRLAAKLWNGGKGARNWDCATIVGYI